MALFAAELLALAGGKRAKGNALINFYIVADLGGFADHDAGTVVDEKVSANGCAGVDINAGFAVGVLGHNTGNKGDLHLVQHMGIAIHKNGIQAGIRENHFLPAVGSGVALKLSVHIIEHPVLNFGQSAHKLQCLFLCLRLDLAVAFGLIAVRKSHLELAEQLFVQKAQAAVGIGFLAHIGHVFSAEKAGEGELAQLVYDLNDLLAVRQALAHRQIKQLLCGVVFSQTAGGILQSGSYIFHD